jgi:hypothetical protein
MDVTVEAYNEIPKSQIIFPFQKSSLARVCLNKKKLGNVVSRNNSGALAPFGFIVSRTVGLAGKCVSTKYMYVSLCSTTFVQNIFPFDQY